MGRLSFSCISTLPGTIRKHCAQLWSNTSPSIALPDPVYSVAASANDTSCLAAHRGAWSGFLCAQQQQLGVMRKRVRGRGCCPA